MEKEGEGREKHQPKPSQIKSSSSASPDVSTRYLKPIVKEWARAQGLEYKSAPLTTMLKEHYDHLKKNAQVAAREVGKDGQDEFAFRP